MKSDKSIFETAVDILHQTGHLWEVPQESLRLLKPSDQVFIDALIRFTKLDSSRYTKHVLQAHGRLPDFDGQVGPAVAAMVTEPNGRCFVPDIAPPPGVSFQFEDPALQQVALRMQEQSTAEALGTGGWKNCHGGDNIHTMAIKINPAGMNPRVAPLWKKILQNVQKAYCGIGLLIRFIGMDNRDLLTGEEWTSTINSDLTFVQSSSGWIGLAIVGQNEKCGSRIWLKLLATYLGGTTDLIIEQQITALLMHEIGHNVSLGHLSGRIMNPSITTGNPVGVWHPDDKATPILQRLFSGVPVPVPGGNPNPPSPPKPPGEKTLEERVWALELQSSMHTVAINQIAKRR